MQTPLVMQLPPPKRQQATTGWQPQRPQRTLAGPSARSGCGVRQCEHSALAAALVRRQAGHVHPGSEAAAAAEAVDVERPMGGTSRCGSGTCRHANVRLES